MPAIKDITIDPNGTVTVSKDITADDYSVTVTAKATDPGYTGSNPADPFKITVLNTFFIYKPDPHQQASKKFFTIGDTDNPYLFLLAGIDKTADVSAVLKIIIYNTDKTADSPKTVTPSKGIIPGLTLVLNSYAK